MKLNYQAICKGADNGPTAKKAKFLVIRAKVKQGGLIKYYNIVEDICDNIINKKSTMVEIEK